MLNNTSGADHVNDVIALSCQTFLGLASIT